MPIDFANCVRVTVRFMVFAWIVCASSAALLFERDNEWSNISGCNSIHSASSLFANFYDDSYEMKTVSRLPWNGCINHSSLYHLSVCHSLLCVLPSYSNPLLFVCVTPSYPILSQATAHSFKTFA